MRSGSTKPEPVVRRALGAVLSKKAEVITFDHLAKSFVRGVKVLESDASSTRTPSPIARDTSGLRISVHTLNPLVNALLQIPLAEVKSLRQIIPRLCRDFGSEARFLIAPTIYLPTRADVVD